MTNDEYTGPDFADLERRAEAKANEQRHTPGPWRYAYGAVWTSDVDSEGEPTTCLLLADRSPSGVASPSERDRNLERTAECVNACEGLDDPVRQVAELRDLVATLAESGAFGHHTARALLAEIGGAS